MINTRRPASRLPEPDEISQVVGSPYYEGPHYPKGLREIVFGPYTRDQVSVARFYLLTTPQVVVDFEPPPQDGKFWSEEKRSFFARRGIVYVPIFLGERLSTADFATRIRVERERMEAIAKEGTELAALAQADSYLRDDDSETFRRWVDQESLRRLAVEIKANPNLRGASKAKRLVGLKRFVAAEARRLGTKPVLVDFTVASTQ